MGKHLPNSTEPKKDPHEQHRESTLETEGDAEAACHVPMRASSQEGRQHQEEEQPHGHTDSQTRPGGRHGCPSSWKEKRGVILNLLEIRICLFDKGSPRPDSITDECH